MQTKVANFQQFVCTACGFNMVGFYPKRCRFCGATPDNFISVEECSAKYRVQSLPVNDKVTQLKSIPQLGYEHAAYQINTGDAVIWIDCPSSFDIDSADTQLPIFLVKWFPSGAAKVLERSLKWYSPLLKSLH
jgi:hydroxyacylglutathione hydrolase